MANITVESKPSLGLWALTKKYFILLVVGVEKCYSIGLLLVGCIFGWLGLFLLPFDWFYIKAVFAWYVFTMFGIMIGYHRYFSHRSFRTSRGFQFFLALCGSLTLMGGPMWWASRHRRHHKECATDGDVHSPERRGFWYAHIGWIISDDFQTDWARMKDFERFPELRRLDGLVSYLYLLEFAVMLYVDRWLPVWILTVGMCITYNIIFSVNSLTHMYGSAPFRSEYNPEQCKAKNIAWLGVVSFGEGWHNNHHSDMGRANHGFVSSLWQIDIGFLIIKVLEFFRLIWDVNSKVLPKDEGTASQSPERTDIGSDKSR